MPARTGEPQRYRMFASSVILRFLLHCWRRASFVGRTVARGAALEDMFDAMSSVSETGRPVALPELAVTLAAELCAFAIPGVWRRRCLFRSLLLLDWAHRLGIRPRLNVGMQLGRSWDRGHCWLSLDEKPFCELRSRPNRYGSLFHRGGDISYWVQLVGDATGAMVTVASIQPDATGGTAPAPD